MGHGFYIDRELTVGRGNNIIAGEPDLPHFHPHFCGVQTLSISEAEIIYIT